MSQPGLLWWNLGFLRMRSTAFSENLIRNSFDATVGDISRKESAEKYSEFFHEINMRCLSFSYFFNSFCI